MDGEITGSILDADEERFDFARGDVRFGATWTRSERRAQLDVEGRLGGTLGDIPRQDLYLVGGRGTLPGFEYRSLAGDRLALGRVTLSADLVRPWLRAKAFGGVGWVGLDGGARAVEAWGVRQTGGRGTVGAGLGIFYDLLQVEVARGIGPRARTQLIIEAQPSFWGFL